jgi:hypothetical protein
MNYDSWNHDGRQYLRRLRWQRFRKTMKYVWPLLVLAILVVANYLPIGAK